MFCASFRTAPGFFWWCSLARVCQGSRGLRRGEAASSGRCLTRSAVLCFLLTSAGSFTRAGWKGVADVAAAAGAVIAVAVPSALHPNWKAWEQSGKGGQEPQPLRGFSSSAQRGEPLRTVAAHFTYAKSQGR